MKESPLYDTIVADKEFYNLFEDFKGYVDFFFLQDCVTDDYSKVDIWCGNADFIEPGLPKTVDEYFEFIEKEFKFLDRIQAHHEKIDFEKLNINEWQFDDLRKNAISTIGAIMQKYGLSKKDL